MIPSSNLTNTPLKIIIDTNLFLSVFVFRGQMVNHIFDLIIDRKVDMYISPALKQEIKKKFDFFNAGNIVYEEVMEFINTKGLFIEPRITIEKYEI